VQQSNQITAASGIFPSRLALNGIFYIFYLAGAMMCSLLERGFPLNELFCRLFYDGAISQPNEMRNKVARKKLIELYIILKRL